VRHCDDYINDPAAPEPLRKFLARARAPAHGALEPEPYPKLFATCAGKRVRVVMASRHGDVGITTRLDREYGYDLRVAISTLTDFAEAP
jgi:hypothetical protein